MSPSQMLFAIAKFLKFREKYLSYCITLINNKVADSADKRMLYINNMVIIMSTIEPINIYLYIDLFINGILLVK